MAEIRNWLNRELGNTHIPSLEDPVEDVFVTNVETPEGNRRIFEGHWESSDYFLQAALHVISNQRAPQEYRNLLDSALASLRLSDCVADRLGLNRWTIEASIPKGNLVLGATLRLQERASAVSFTGEDLTSLGVSHKTLTPFILREEDKIALVSESTGHSCLVRRPLIDFDGGLILALPNAVSPAIRLFILSALQELGLLNTFEDELQAYQVSEVENDGLWQLKAETESLEPPEPDGPVPTLNVWLLKYDTNKYLHVMLLHDRLDWLVSQGLSSFMQYPEAIRNGLEGYVKKVADYCRAMPDFAEGMTLIVMAGLGRGFMLTFADWPEQWRLSVIRISDLLMLAGEVDRPIERYLKCIKQKESVENEGVYFQNINGDYNLYCYWRRMNSRLVPQELPVGDGSMIVIGSDMVLSVRREVRQLTGRHVISTVGGAYARVERFGRDAFFESMQGRAIYASVEHMRAGTLAGAVETTRGPSWLVVEPRREDATIAHILYEMWSGFISLYDRLVFEIESTYPSAPLGPVEIRLNFSELVVPEKYVKPRSNVEIIEASAHHSFPCWRHIDRHLVKWVKWEYKKKGQYSKRARRWLGQVAEYQPELFAHWRLGAPFPAE